MLNNFYKRQNDFKENLIVFTEIGDNDKLILKNNRLTIKNIVEDNDCSNFFPILLLLKNIISNENYNENDLTKFLEQQFTKYLEFIDSIIYYMYKKQCFQDQYLILLSEIEKSTEKIKQGLTKLIITHRKDKLSIMYKSILFSFFDFSKLLIEIKNKVNTENTTSQFHSINKMKNDKTYSF